MKKIYALLVILLALAVITTGCDDKKKKEDTINGEDDDTGDDDDNGNGGSTTYTTVAVDDLNSTPYSYSGKNVKVVDAEVTSVPQTFYCYITDDSTSSTVKLYGYDEDLGIKVGDVITVQGIFEQFENKYWEIKIRSKTDDKVTITDSVTVAYTSIGLEALLSDPDSYYGLSVELKDVTVVNKDSYYHFKLTNDKTTEKLAVYNDGLYLKQFKEGDTITIKGQFIEYNDAPELKLRNETAYDDGVVSVTDGGGGTTVTYEVHTVSEILGDPESFEGDNVQLTDVKVAWIDDGNSAAFTLFGVTDDTRAETLEIVAFNKIDENDIAKIVPDAIVTVKGKMGYYDQNKNDVKDEDEDWQVTVSSYSDSDEVIIVEEAAAITYSEVTLNELLGDTDTYNESDVKVLNAEITTLEERSSGLKINITDASYNGTLILFIPNDADQPTGLAVGNTINIWGQFKWWPHSHEGYWEVILRENGQDKVEKV